VKRGGHLTKSGWSKPHTHSTPTNLALFRHKITLYRFNQGGSYYCSGLKSEQGLIPLAPLNLTTGVALRNSKVRSRGLTNGVHKADILTEVYAIVSLGLQTQVCR